MAITAFMNQKGGVGKTTSVINLSAQSALKEKTLMVDCDKQANLTSQFVEDPEKTIREIFLGGSLEPLKIEKNLHLLPSGIDLAGVDLLINHEPGRESKLKDGMKQYLGKNYKNVFIDCPPDISLITMNALVCADYVILPIKAAKFSIEGIEIMIDFIRKVRENYNPNLTVLGMLITQHDERLKIGKSVRDEIEKLGWSKALFDTSIRRNTDIEQAQFCNMNIFDYNKKSNAAVDYMKLGHEIAKKIRKIEKETALV